MSTEARVVDVKTGHLEGVKGGCKASKLPKPYWTPKERFLGRFPAINGGFSDDQETGLIGRYGEVWEKSPGVYGVWCTHPTAANAFGRTIRRDEECVITTTDLELAAKAVRVYRQRAKQAEVANKRSRGEA